MKRVILILGLAAALGAGLDIKAAAAQGRDRRRLHRRTG